jgi:aldehyde:ferredoxin oxidoreductase
MGADHTSGPSLGRTETSHIVKEGQLDFAVSAQKNTAAADSNVCLFSWAGVVASGADYASAVNAAYGFDWSFGDILEMGAQTVKAERDFNSRAGFTPAHDCLPEFFYAQPSPATGAVYDITAEEIAEKWRT